MPSDAATDDCGNRAALELQSLERCIASLGLKQLRLHGDLSLWVQNRDVGVRAHRETSLVDLVELVKAESTGRSRGEKLHEP